MRRDTGEEFLVNLPLGQGRGGHSAARAALFDVDRTLVSVNSGRLYVRWRMQRRETTLLEALRAGRWLLQYSLGLMDAYLVAERTVGNLAGYSEARMRAECEQWYAEVVRPFVSDRARREVEACRREGYIPVILSAQTHFGTEPLARDLGIDHILCSRVHVADGKLTGDFDRPLCYGDGKRTLATRWARRHDIDLGQSRFYSDSISDLPMLEAVGEPRIVNPDPRLRLVAYSRRWCIETWR